MEAVDTFPQDLVLSRSGGEAAVEPPRRSSNSSSDGSLRITGNLPTTAGTAVEGRHAGIALTPEQVQALLLDPTAQDKARDEEQEEESSAPTHMIHSDNPAVSKPVNSAGNVSPRYINSASRPPLASNTSAAPTGKPPMHASPLRRPSPRVLRTALAVQASPRQSYQPSLHETNSLSDSSTQMQTMEGSGVRPVSAERTRNSRTASQSSMNFVFSSQLRQRQQSRAHSAGSHRSGSFPYGGDSAPPGQMEDSGRYLVMGARGSSAAGFSSSSQCPSENREPASEVYSNAALDSQPALSEPFVGNRLIPTQPTPTISNRATTDTDAAQPPRDAEAPVLRSEDPLPEYRTAQPQTASGRALHEKIFGTRPRSSSLAGSPMASGASTGPREDGAAGTRLIPGGNVNESSSMGSSLASVALANMAAAAGGESAGVSSQARDDDTVAETTAARPVSRPLSASSGRPPLSQSAQGGTPRSASASVTATAVAATGPGATRGASLTQRRPSPLQQAIQQQQLHQQVPPPGVHVYQNWPNVREEMATPTGGTGSGLDGYALSRPVRANSSPTLTTHHSAGSTTITTASVSAPFLSVSIEQRTSPTLARATADAVQGGQPMVARSSPGRQSPVVPTSRPASASISAVAPVAGDWTLQRVRAYIDRSTALAEEGRHTDAMETLMSVQLSLEADAAAAMQERDGTGSRLLPEQRQRFADEVGLQMQAVTLHWTEQIKHDAAQRAGLTPGRVPAVAEVVARAGAASHLNVRTSVMTHKVNHPSKFARLEDSVPGEEYQAHDDVVQLLEDGRARPGNATTGDLVTIDDTDRDSQPNQSWGSARGKPAHVVGVPPTHLEVDQLLPLEGTEWEAVVGVSTHHGRGDAPLRRNTLSVDVISTDSSLVRELPPGCDDSKLGRQSSSPFEEHVMPPPDVDGLRSSRRHTHTEGCVESASTHSLFAQSVPHEGPASSPMSSTAFTTATLRSKQNELQQLVMQQRYLVQGRRLSATAREMSDNSSNSELLVQEGAETIVVPMQMTYTRRRTGADRRRSSVVSPRSATKSRLLQLRQQQQEEADSSDPLPGAKGDDDDGGASERSREGARRVSRASAMLATDGDDFYCEHAQEAEVAAFNVLYPKAVRRRRSLASRSSAATSTTSPRAVHFRETSPNGSAIEHIEDEVSAVSTTSSSVARLAAQVLSTSRRVSHASAMVAEAGDDFRYENAQEMDIAAMEVLYPKGGPRRRRSRVSSRSPTSSIADTPRSAAKGDDSADAVTATSEVAMADKEVHEADDDEASDATAKSVDVTTAPEPEEEEELYPTEEQDGAPCVEEVPLRGVLDGVERSGESDLAVYARHAHNRRTIVAVAVSVPEPETSLYEVAHVQEEEEEVLADPESPTTRALPTISCTSESNGEAEVAVANKEDEEDEEEVMQRALEADLARVATTDPLSARANSTTSSLSNNNSFSGSAPNGRPPSVPRQPRPGSGRQGSFSGAGGSQSSRPPLSPRPSMSLDGGSGNSTALARELDVEGVTSNEEHAASSPNAQPRRGSKLVFSSPKKFTEADESPAAEPSDEVAPRPAPEEEEEEGVPSPVFSDSTTESRLNSLESSGGLQDAAGTVNAERDQAKEEEETDAPQPRPKSVGAETLAGEDDDEKFSESSSSVLARSSRAVKVPSVVLSPPQDTVESTLEEQTTTEYVEASQALEAEVGHQHEVHEPPQAGGETLSSYSSSSPTTTKHSPQQHCLPERALGASHSVVAGPSHSAELCEPSAASLVVPETTDEAVSTAASVGVQALPSVALSTCLSDGDSQLSHKEAEGAEASLPCLSTTEIQRSQPVSADVARLPSVVLPQLEESHRSTASTESRQEMAICASTEEPLSTSAVCEGSFPEVTRASEPPSVASAPASASASVLSATEEVEAKATKKRKSDSESRKSLSQVASERTPQPAEASAHPIHSIVLSTRSETSSVRAEKATDALAQLSDHVSEAADAEPHHRPSITSPHSQLTTSTTTCFSAIEVATPRVPGKAATGPAGLGSASARDPLTHLHADMTATTEADNLSTTTFSLSAIEVATPRATNRQPPRRLSKPMSPIVGHRASVALSGKESREASGVFEKTGAVLQESAFPSDTVDARPDSEAPASSDRRRSTATVNTVVSSAVTTATEESDDTAANLIPRADVGEGDLSTDIQSEEPREVTRVAADSIALSSSVSNDAEEAHVNPSTVATQEPEKEKEASHNAGSQGDANEEIPVDACPEAEERSTSAVVATTETPGLVDLGDSQHEEGSEFASKCIEVTEDSTAPSDEGSSLHGCDRRSRDSQVTEPEPELKDEQNDGNEERDIAEHQTTEDAAQTPSAPTSMQDSITSPPVVDATRVGASEPRTPVAEGNASSTAVAGSKDEDVDREVDLPSPPPFTDKEEGTPEEHALAGDEDATETFVMLSEDPDPAHISNSAVVSSPDRETPTEHEAPARLETAGSVDKATAPLTATATSLTTPTFTTTLSLEEHARRRRRSWVYSSEVMGIRLKNPNSVPTLALELGPQTGTYGFHTSSPSRPPVSSTTISPVLNVTVTGRTAVSATPMDSVELIPCNAQKAAPSTPTAERVQEHSSEPEAPHEYRYTIPPAEDADEQTTTSDGRDGDDDDENENYDTYYSSPGRIYGFPPSLGPDSRTYTYIHASELIGERLSTASPRPSTTSSSARPPLDSQQPHTKTLRKTKLCLRENRKETDASARSPATGDVSVSPELGFTVITTETTRRTVTTEATVVKEETAYTVHREAYTTKCTDETTSKAETAAGKSSKTLPYPHADLGAFVPASQAFPPTYERSKLRSFKTFLQSHQCSPTVDEKGNTTTLSEVDTNESMVTRPVTTAEAVLPPKDWLRQRRTLGSGSSRLRPSSATPLSPQPTKEATATATTSPKTRTLSPSSYANQAKLNGYDPEAEEEERLLFGRAFVTRVRGGGAGLARESIQGAHYTPADGEGQAGHIFTPCPVGRVKNEILSDTSVGDDSTKRMTPGQTRRASSALPGVPANGAKVNTLPTLAGAATRRVAVPTNVTFHSAFLGAARKAGATMAAAKQSMQNNYFAEGTQGPEAAVDSTADRDTLVQ